MFSALAIILVYLSYPYEVIYSSDITAVTAILPIYLYIAYVLVLALEDLLHFHIVEPIRRAALTENFLHNFDILNLNFI